MQPTHKPGIYSAAREQKPSGLPPLDKVTAMTNRKARDVIERAGYEVTGYVFTHKLRAAKCFLDMSRAVWLTVEDLDRLMEWKKPKGNAPVPPGFEEPPADVTEGEKALQQTAMRLGIGFNSMIPHNAGWFVPGVAKAYRSAGDAIEALFELIYAAPDATVYRPGSAPRGSAPLAEVVEIPKLPPREPKPASEPKRAPEPVQESPQVSLF